MSSLAADTPSLPQAQEACGELCGQGGPEKALGQSKKFTLGLMAQIPGSFPNQGPNSVNVDSLRRCIVTPAYGTRIVVNIEEGR